jgi:PAS domain S-box-containing protein
MQFAPTANIAVAEFEEKTGRSCQSLIENPSSYEEVIHPDDRAHILGKLADAAQDRKFDERFRIIRPSGEGRWVWAHGFPVRDGEGKINRLVGTALEITAQKEAGDQGATNLALAQSPSAFSKLNSPAHRYLYPRFNRNLAISPARLEARIESLFPFL